MIIFDTNQFIISKYFSIKEDGEDVNVDLLRYNLISSIKAYEEQYPSYGNVILAFDSFNYWRKSLFPFYKSNRKKERKDSDVDWNKVHNLISQFRREFKNNLKYLVIEIESCEADDIIAVLVDSFKDRNKLIVSDDKDFFQLLTNPRTVLYRPRSHEKIVSDTFNRSDIESSLNEHIIRGDRSDGIPNILSEDNCLSEGIRQKAITRKFLDSISTRDLDKDPKYLRNKSLIDFKEIPKNIKVLILKTFKEEIENQPAINKKEYFEHHKIESLL